MKPIFQSNARSRRHRQAQSPEPQTEQTPFFAAADQHEVQTKPQPFFQAKAAGVKIGQPNDVYEQEADAVADKVVNGQTAHSTNGAAATGVQRLPITPLGSGSLQRLSTPEEDKMPGTNDARMAQDKKIQEKPEAGSPMLQKMDAPKEEEKPVQKMGEKEEEPVQAKEEEEQPVQKMDAPKEEEKPLQKMGEKEEEPVQTKEEEEQPVQAKASPGAQNASPNLGARLSQKKGSGNPLPKSVRAEMEQGIGADFSGVRIHTDNDAVDMNKEVHAQAFTHGQDVYFNSGKFNPEQTEGKRLLAHELTHVVQQGGGKGNNQIQEKRIQRFMGGLGKRMRSIWKRLKRAGLKVAGKLKGWMMKGATETQMIFSRFAEMLTYLDNALKGNATQSWGMIIYGKGDGKDDTATKASKGASIFGSFDFAKFMEYMDLILKVMPKGTEYRKTIEGMRKELNAKKIDKAAAFIFKSAKEIKKIKEEFEGQKTNNTKETNNDSAQEVKTNLENNSAPNIKQEDHPAPTGKTQIGQWVTYDLSGNMYIMIKYNDGTKRFKFASIFGSKDIENPGPMDWRRVQ